MTWKERLPTLFAMKAGRQVHYVGLTPPEGRCRRDIEQIMRSQPLDFLQVSYTVLDREVEPRIILLLAQERGIINRPFRQGELIDSVMRHSLAPWAARGVVEGQTGEELMRNIKALEYCS
jgi:hypothetical protein